MNDPQIRIKRDEEYSMRGNVKYICEVWHKGLNDYRYLSASDKDVLESKVESHINKLQLKWEKEVEKKSIANSKQASQREAELRTKAAKADLEALDELLTFTLEIDDSINWDSLINQNQYPISNPSDLLGNKIISIPKLKKEPYKELPERPDPEDIKYKPKLDFIDKLFTNFGKNKVKQKEELYNTDLSTWETESNRIKSYNEGITKKFIKQNQEYDNKVEALRAQTYEDSKKWEAEKDTYYKKQEEFNLKVQKLKSDYFDGKPEAIIEACEIVLNNSMYPDFLQKNFEIEYIPETKILIVEYSVPAPEQLPTLQEVKFIKDELKEYHISETQKAKNFDSLVYKLTLRTLHELFEADQVNSIEAISFNGWVNSIDRSTGKRVNNCIVSIQAKKDEFMQFDLEHVDPKACFKALKGVGSSKLVGLTAVQPILKIDKTDRRFVEHYDVADSIDDSTNIASMGWEDFEHLIREVFAKEFNQNGGEVKVTQASKDGGVDAIAFDPDPIRGGKIVIQAKRYTNTVGVSAVRDLYGTVLNEGATKGVLVTTADYGPDAYEFSKGKPITLMNGANLLYLLEKHGHKAKIDIKEAKLMMKNK